MNKLKLLYKFFSQFGNAYVENNVPSKAVLPYLTYNISISEWTTKSILTVSIFSRSTSFMEVSTLADKILDSIGEGVIITDEQIKNCKLVIRKGNPTLINVPNEDETIKQFYLNLELNTLEK